MNQQLLSILGPTASGKSAVAMCLAQRLDGEIISCDSMQIYRDLDIGTAKPSQADREAVPHHLVDILPINEAYNAKRFLQDADAAVREIFARQRQPILCGGTGLYARALLYGFRLWPKDAEIAEELRREHANGNQKRLLTELQQANPELAARIGDNPRHWLRALEVLRISGELPTEQEHFDVPGYAAPEYILMPPPKLTRRLVANRTSTMLAAGWIDEVRKLQEEALLQAPTASQALGYKLIAQYLEGTISSIDELTRKIVTATCRYAKRQRTWFRHQHPRAIQVPVSEEDTAVKLAERILAQAKSNGNL